MLKKLLFILGLGAVVVSCQSKEVKLQNVETETVVSDIYVGELPAADCPGIVYELTLNAESL